MDAAYLLLLLALAGATLGFLLLCENLGTRK